MDSCSSRRRFRETTDLVVRNIFRKKPTDKSNRRSEEREIIEMVDRPKKSPRSNDSDIDLSDADDGHGYDDEMNDSDEESVLQRLTGNYRRFSETQRFREREQNNASLDIDGLESNVPIHARNLNESSFDDDIGLDDEDMDAFLGEESDDENRDVGSAEEGREDHEEEGEEQLQRGNEEDEIDSFENSSFAHSAALAMLANALSSSGRTSDEVSELEHFINQTRGRSFPSNNQNSVEGRNLSEGETRENSSNRHGNQSPNMFFMNSLLNHVIPHRSSRIAGLIDGLNTHDNAYLIMETLNEISSSLLMMSSIQSERQVPTFKLAEALVRVINEYPDDLELQLVGCRCIYNLAEVNFNCISEIVSAGVIETLNEKLLDLSYIDMAEQALQALEIISRRAGRQCLVKGSVPIVLAYLDFFTIHAQRKALQICANASVNIPQTKASDVQTAFATIKSVATTYPDPQCVESAWIFIANTIKSFQYTPSLLTNLLDLEFLQKICNIFPLALGNGNRSSGLVKFKTCIFLLNSFTMLANNSSKFSNNLLTECDIVSMITKSFASYSNAIDSNDIDSQSSVSIDVLLKCPKDLLIAFLKLISVLLPLKDSSTKFNNHNDVGNYTQSNQSANLEKIKLLESEHNNMNNFFSSIFPLLLNIYDATVEYRVRRLVLIVVLRLIHLMAPEQLEKIVYHSKITLTLASSITHGKNLFKNKVGKQKEKELTRNYSLLYGSLLITQSLINCNPEVFLSDFMKEGLISQMKDLSAIFQSEFQNIVDHDIESSAGLYDFSTQEISDESNSDNIEIDYEEEEEEEEESDSYGGDYEEDESHVHQAEINDLDSATEGLSQRIPYKNGTENTSSFKQKAFSIMDDGLGDLSMRSILDSLSALSISIHDDYDRLLASNKVVKSENFQFLESFKEKLDADLAQLNRSDWDQLWSSFANSLHPKANGSAISSFELISSGVVQKLVEVFETHKDHNLAMHKSFQHVFCSSFSPCVNEQASPLAFIVKALEEALDRNESFGIVGSDSDINRTPKFRTASMTKQMRVKLQPCDSDTTGQVRGFLLVVHAIATFETIQNFIKSSKSINIRNTTNLNSSSLDGDFHYDFYLNGEKVPSDATIYGAIYKSLENKYAQLGSTRENIMKTTHVIQYKTVPGKLVLDDNSANEETLVDPLEIIADKNILMILKLLKILHSFNSNIPNPSTSDNIFMNYKLTAKLNRQLDEPLIVASGILPEWSVILPREFPFLFPIETRIFFLKSTSFGYSRLIDYWLNRSKEENTNNNHSGRTPMLGRSIRHKLRISRERIFSSAVKVMESYATNPGLLEIEFFDEVGSGLGPTLEFYSEVSKSFSRVKLHMWRSDQYCKQQNTDVSKDKHEVHIHNAHGLFPRPLHKMDPHFNNTLLYFKVLGKFLARSFIDSRLIDFHFNPLFFQLAMKYACFEPMRVSLEESIELIKLIDESLSSSLRHLNLYLTEFRHTPEEERADFKIMGATVSDLMLTFVLPGYEEIKLIPGGDDVSVTAENLDLYISAIVEYTLYDGVSQQIKSFVDGFSEVFPFSSLKLFSPEELTRLSGNAVENWSVETLLAVVRSDHGYTNHSQQIEWLIDIMSKFEKEERRKFLKFITGSPRLPFNGFKGLSPPFTVVLKHTEDNLRPDDYLPSVMTCANYLKLPRYSSREVMLAKIKQAMNEGTNAFLLS